MNDTFQGLMREATRLTQSGKLTQATALIQRAMKQAAPSAKTDRRVSAAEAHSKRRQPQTSLHDVNQNDVLDGCVRVLEEVPVAVEAVEAVETAEAFQAPHPFDVAPGLGRRTVNAPVVQETFACGQFVSNSQSHQYKLYSPGQQASQRPLPLVVMLHGCTQNPDDFSVGTGMNVVARGADNTPSFYVLYPSQTRSANAQGCWNWFDRAHQSRGQGEPAWIAALTEQLLRTLPIDKRRVCVAGLSAGGAMAAIVAAVYPDIFAAVGVHSGLPVGAARNLTEALTAMKHGPSTSTTSAPATPAQSVPTIVFHGDQDRTVHARNAQGLVDAATVGLETKAIVQSGVSAGGRRHTRSVHARSGKPHAELWELHGAGHAWSGGHPAGSHTDAKGVNATLEMIKFFLQHQLPR
jgi:poly(hydroxyalkanoate) depolymerase family esterase